MWVRKGKHKEKERPGMEAVVAVVTELDTESTDADMHTEVDRYMVGIVVVKSRMEIEVDIEIQAAAEVVVEKATLKDS